ncbi:MAG: CHASE2 domain-containing protein, partial [Burkholderiales bacterium]
MAAMRRLLTSRPRRVLAGLALTLRTVLHVAGELRLPVVDALDRMLYDARLKLHRVQAQPRVVIVDIDEKSLAAQGRWPWSRQSIARLTEQLAGRGDAAVIGFDIVFAEPEGVDRLALIDRMAADPAFSQVRGELQKMASELDHDRQLATVLEQRPVVLSYYFTSDRGGRTAGSLPAPVLAIDDLARLGYRVTSWNGYGANLGAFQAAARRAGFFNPRLDSDGVVRELPVLAAYGDAVYESFALAVLRTYLGDAVLALDDAGVSVRGSRGAVALPLTGDSTALVPFAGAGGPAGGRFRYLSATDVIEGRFDPKVVRDAIGLVGTSAPGLTDLRATPVSEVYPGVEIHASLIAGALEGVLKTRPAGDSMLSAALLALLGMFLAFAMPAMAMPGIAFVGGIAALTLTGWASIAYSNLGWILSLAPGLTLVGGLAVLNFAAGYFVEGRAKRAVVERFGEYVAPQVVERMVRNPHSYRLDSENRELTILFADIRGFTRISEAM